MEKWKVVTKKKARYTISVVGNIDSHIRGYDKFGKFIILPLDEIEKLVPVETEVRK